MSLSDNLRRLARERVPTMLPVLTSCERATPDAPEKATTERPFLKMTQESWLMPFTRKTKIVFTCGNSSCNAVPALVASG